MSRRAAYKRLWLMAVVAVALQADAAAPPCVVRTWQSDEGLPDNTVMGVGQTPDGFLWVATKTGLSRFDGVQFREFPVVSDGMPADRIMKLLADRRGRLWVAKERGAVVCVERGRAAAVGVPELGESGDGVRFMTEDADGTVWLCYNGGAVVRVQDGQVRLFAAADGLPERGFCQFAVDGAGRLWFAKDGWVGVLREGRFRPLERMPVQFIAGARSGGVWCYLDKNIVCKYTEEGKRVSVPLDIPELTPTALHEDRLGSLWLGTREQGLYRFDRAGAAAVVLTQQTVLNITEDREGNLWVGTRGGGLNQVKPRAAELLATGAGVPFGGVRSVCQDTAGQLWAVIWPNGQIMRGAGQDGAPLTVRDGWSVPNAKCVEADPKGGVWIGTEYVGLYRWQDGAVTDSYCLTNGLGAGMVNALRVTGSGAVWIGTGTVEEQPQVLQCLEDKKFQTFQLPPGSGLVAALETDAAGDCWAATSRGRLLRVRKGVLTDETAQTLGAPTEIRCLLGTPDGSLWIGTGGHGLGRLKDGRFSRCRMSQGLRDDYISNMLPDGLGRLWFAGNRGLFSAREKDLIDLMEGRTARVWTAAYGRNEGMLRLQASYDSWPGAVRGADGRLFFAMQSGLAVVYAAQVKTDQEPPPVLIEQVKVNGKTVAAFGLAGVPSGTDASSLAELGRDGVHLRLAPGRRQVEFAFTALGFNMPEALGFRYRLQGFDTEWNEAGTRRSASYRQLLPGHYRFEVNACSSDGLWNKTGAALELTAEPFWWETSWFRLAGPLSGAGLLCGWVVLWLRRRQRVQIERLEMLRAAERERAQHELAMDAERIRIARDLHDDLGASLTEISILADTGLRAPGPGETVPKLLRSITDKARHLVAALDAIVWVIAPAENSLQSLADYLAGFAEDYLTAAGIACRFKIPVTLPAVKLDGQARHELFMVVKETLHNVVQHAGATVVELHIKLQDGRLLIAIVDNGAGFDAAAAPTGHGLQNFSERLGQLGGECAIDSRPGQGTTVTFSLPMADVAAPDGGARTPG